MKKLIIFLMLSLVTYSCNEDTEDPRDDLIAFQKSQGQCGETWGTRFLDYENGKGLAAAAQFLDSVNISTNGLRIYSLDQGAICVTCHDCPSGWYYILDAHPDDEQVLIDLQFTRQ